LFSIDHVFKWIMNGLLSHIIYLLGFFFLSNFMFLFYLFYSRKGDKDGHVSYVVARRSGSETLEPLTTVSVSLWQGVCDV